MDDALPEGVGVTINTSEGADGTGSITLTVSSWPKAMLMNNRERVLAARRALLDGKDLQTVDLTAYPFLSPEATYLSKTLQELLNHRCPSRLNPTSGAEEWPIVGDVVFDPRRLARERTEIVQALKTTHSKS